MEEGLSKDEPSFGGLGGKEREREKLARRGREYESRAARTPAGEAVSGGAGDACPRGRLQSPWVEDRGVTVGFSDVRVTGDLGENGLGVGEGRRLSGAAFERTWSERLQRLVFPGREEKPGWGQCRAKTRTFAYLSDRSVSVFNERNNGTYRLMTQAGDGRVAGAGREDGAFHACRGGSWRGPVPGAPTSVGHRSEGAGAGQMRRAGPVGSLCSLRGEAR